MVRAEVCLLCQPLGVVEAGSLDVNDVKSTLDVVFVDFTINWLTKKTFCEAETMFHFIKKK